MAARPPEPAVCKVGRAQQVITPPVGVSLAGYFHDRKAERVRDDLHAKAVMIESGDRRVALVSCDLICVTAEVVDAAKAMVSWMPPTFSVVIVVLVIILLGAP